VLILWEEGGGGRGGEERVIPTGGSGNKAYDASSDIHEGEKTLRNCLRHRYSACFCLFVCLFVCLFLLLLLLLLWLLWLSADDVLCENRLQGIYRSIKEPKAGLRDFFF